MKNLKESIKYYSSLYPVKAQEIREFKLTENNADRFTGLLKVMDPDIVPAVEDALFAWLDYSLIYCQGYLYPENIETVQSVLEDFIETYGPIND